MLNIFRGFVFLLLACAGVAHGADTGWLTSPQNDHARIRFQAEKGNDRIDGLLSIELARRAKAASPRKSSGTTGNRRGGTGLPRQDSRFPA